MVVCVSIEGVCVMGACQAGIPGRVLIEGECIKRVCHESVSRGCVTPASAASSYCFKANRAAARR